MSGEATQPFSQSWTRTISMVTEPVVGDSSRGNVDRGLKIGLL